MIEPGNKFALRLIIFPGECSLLAPKHIAKACRTVPDGSQPVSGIYIIVET